MGRRELLWKFASRGMCVEEELVSVDSTGMLSALGKATMDIDPLYLAPTQLAGKVPTYIFRGREVITIYSHRMKTATPGMF